MKMVMGRIYRGEIYYMIRKKDIYEESLKKIDQKKMYQVRRSREHKADISIRCKRCNQFLLGYDLAYDDEKRILDGVTLPPCRCKRVFTRMNYTEGILRKRAVNNIVRI